MPRPLAGLKVLVTRPAHQAHDLCARIGGAGGEPLLFPLIEIVPAADERALTETVAGFGHIDMLIFISANAVLHALPALRAARALASGPRLAAVGKGTAKALAEQGCPATLSPARRFDSEGLLELPELQADAVRGRRVVIARGAGGRETLAETLAARGAEVRYLEVYRRARPALDLAEHPWAARGEVDIILVTSGEALSNLGELLHYPAWLKNTPLLAISPRLADTARAQGYRQVIAAPRADDAGLLAALLEWRGGRQAPLSGIHA